MFNNASVLGPEGDLGMPSLTQLDADDDVSSLAQGNSIKCEAQKQKALIEKKKKAIAD